jgi:hypothetical protein
LLSPQATRSAAEGFAANAQLHYEAGRLAISLWGLYRAAFGFGNATQRRFLDEDQEKCLEKLREYLAKMCAVGPLTG